MQDYDADDQQAGGHQLCRVCRYNGSNNRDNRSCGDQRQYFNGLLRKFLKEVIDDKTKYDRNDDNLYD